VSPLLFDEPYYIEINEVRWKMAHRAIDAFKKQAPGGLITCADVAAGPGWFSEKLAEIGLRVTGIEGRRELLDVAARRVPQARFVQANVEIGQEISALGTFDLVFCFGLLYHTENPFAVVRNLAALTGKVLFIESQVLPTDEPILRLVSEGQNETQGLTFHSIIASRTALVKMLQVAGFSWVAEYTGSIAHPDFQDTAERYRRRGVYLAARQPSQMPDFRTCPPAQAPKYDFAKPRR
jgi:SAM-dependent methyltransferase